LAYAQYFAGLYSHRVPTAAITDTTAPTFAGITGLTANINGSLTASWSAGTDSSTPIEYVVYVQASTATGLFNSSNIAQIISALGAHIYVLNDLSRLQKGVVYYVGVRAKDALSNIDSNVVSMNATSAGVLDDDLATIAASLAATELLLAADHTNLAADHVNFQSDHTNFQTDHTNFGTDHTNFGTDHTNFQTDHTNFQADDSAFDTDHSNFVDVYNDLVAVEADLAAEKSSCKGVFAIGNTNDLTAELWFEFKGQAVTSLLGTASYTVYDSDDNAVAGLTESGLTANGNGIYKITPVSAAGLEPFVNYRVKIAITYDSVLYTSYKGFTVGE
jgi:hypothetical protein